MCLIKCSLKVDFIKRMISGVGLLIELSAWPFLMSNLRMTNEPDYDKGDPVKSIRHQGNNLCFSRVFTSRIHFPRMERET